MNGVDEREDWCKCSIVVDIQLKTTTELLLPGEIKQGSKKSSRPGGFSAGSYHFTTNVVIL